jgi:hypothetical protein
MKRGRENEGKCQRKSKKGDKTEEMGSKRQGATYWKITPPPPGGDISQCHLGGIYERGREIGG